VREVESTAATCKRTEVGRQLNNVMQTAFILCSVTSAELVTRISLRLL